VNECRRDLIAARCIGGYRCTPGHQSHYNTWVSSFTGKSTGIDYTDSHHDRGNYSIQGEQIFHHIVFHHARSLSAAAAGISRWQSRDNDSVACKSHCSPMFYRRIFAVCITNDKLNHWQPAPVTIPGRSDSENDASLSYVRTAQLKTRRAHLGRYERSRWW